MHLVLFKTSHYLFNGFCLLTSKRMTEASAARVTYPLKVSICRLNVFSICHIHRGVDKYNILVLT